jgi:large subunit ribosomal protein L18
MLINKKERRTKRAKKTRCRISLNVVARLTIFRTNSHIYASIISPDGAKVLVTASTNEPDVRKILLGNKAQTLKCGGNIYAASIVGRRIAEKAKGLHKIEKVAFDRSGFAYHGRVKALAEAARQAGLQF